MEEAVRRAGTRCRAGDDQLEAGERDPPVAHHQPDEGIPGLCAGAARGRDARSVDGGERPPHADDEAQAREGDGKVQCRDRLDVCRTLTGREGKLRPNMSLPAGKEPTLRVVPMPADENQAGDIFGGWIMSQVDIAGSVAAVRVARGRVATVAVNSFQ